MNGKLVDEWKTRFNRQTRSLVNPITEWLLWCWWTGFSRSNERIHHFQLWFAPKRNHLFHLRQSHHDTDDTISSFQQGYSLFLYPDGTLLRTHILFNLIIPGISAVILDIRFGALSFILYITLFVIVNHVLLRQNPAFPKLANLIPARLLPWLLGQIPRIDLTKRDRDLICNSAGHCDTMLRTWMQATETKKLSTRFRMPPPSLIERHSIKGRWTDLTSDMLLRAAIGNFYGSQTEPSTPDQSIGWWRFLLFWCAPVWMGYLALFLPTVLAIAYPTLILQPNLTPRSVLPLTLWLGMSATFLKHVYGYLRSDELQIDPRKLHRYPTSIYPYLHIGTNFRKAVMRPTPHMMASAITTSAFLIYVSILTLK